MKKTIKSPTGFTIIELMITIAIGAVIAAIAVPSFIDQRNLAKLKDAASMIRADLEVARSWAIRENALATVLVSAGEYHMVVDHGAGGGVAENWVRDGEERIICNRRFPAGVRIDLSQTTLDSQRTRFNGRGYITNNGIITLSSANGKSATINMNNRFGRITSD